MVSIVEHGDWRPGDKEETRRRQGEDKEETRRIQGEDKEETRRKQGGDKEGKNSLLIISLKQVSVAQFASAKKLLPQ